MHEYWKNILKKNLILHPAKHCKDKLYRHEHRNDFFTQANIIITIKTKYKHYIFGGHEYHANVSLEKDYIKIIFSPPKFCNHQKDQCEKVIWGKISQIVIQYLSIKQ